MFSIDLNSVEITQLTDFPAGKPAGIQNTFINPVKNEAIFTKDAHIIAIDLQTFEENVLYEATSKYGLGNLSCTADGAWICACIKEDLSDRIKTELGASYIGFEETCRAKPHCQIVLIPVSGGEAKVIHEDRVWIGHVNASPTAPNLLSFCHEGPWDLVDHWIWCLNIQTGEVWKIRASEDNVFVGHEYWHDDGVRIGYHDYTESLTNKDGKFIGSVRYDNTETFIPIMLTTLSEMGSRQALIMAINIKIRFVYGRKPKANSPARASYAGTGAAFNPCSSEIQPGRRKGVVYERHDRIRESVSGGCAGI